MVSTFSLYVNHDLIITIKKVEFSNIYIIFKELGSKSKQ